MSGEAAASGLRFFLDRGLGAFVVPGALRAAGWMLETMDERYGADQSQGIQDTQWIALSNASIAGTTMAQWYLDHEAKIVRTALRAKGPYVMVVNPSYGLRRAKLAYPPH